MIVLLAIYLPTSAAADEIESHALSLFRRFCFDCHANDSKEGNVDIQRLASERDFANQFKTWEKVVHVLEAKRMPPKDAEQPVDSERSRLSSVIQQELNSYIQENSGDPGHVVLRRLTSAEFAYTIQDLTGLDLQLEKTFVNDAVGGEGFTNVGAAQFMQDSSLERYLEAAKQVADHAVIGAGPLTFFKDPGQTGRELSAIHRIMRLYRKFGFRTAAGEGAEPFGLELYANAFYVAWCYRHRAELGSAQTSLADLARKEGLSDRFGEHIWNVVTSPKKHFPLSQIVDAWQAIPPPTGEYIPLAERDVSATSKPNHREQAARTACAQLGNLLREWQSTLAAAAGDEEEAAVLGSGKLTVDSKHSFNTTINWEEGVESAHFELSVSSASNRSAAGAIVVWKNPRLRFRKDDNRRTSEVPLAAHLSPETLARLELGNHPRSGRVGEDDFVLRGDSKVELKLLIPKNMLSAQFAVDVELDVAHGSREIVRCRIADGEVPGETAAEVGASSALLADASTSEFSQWLEGVAEFARVLPEVSHREPAPSDRDPIPAPFDNAYNKLERNRFHTAIKYHRDDRFLVEYILDDQAREELDIAWTDLLTAFEYHTAFLRFVQEKFEITADNESFEIASRKTEVKLSETDRAIVQGLREEFVEMQLRLLSAESRHVEDALRLAERAWRRPLVEAERSRLRTFYHDIRGSGQLDHTKAIRALLARILVAPAFLYHAQSMAVPPEDVLANPTRDARKTAPTAPGGIVPLADWELASRLSYFLWSSLPDDELRRAAAAGELSNSDKLAAQVKRMLQDEKARRMASEFFGQWFGFYRFDGYRGIDAKRFPEFDEQLRSAMHDEAVSFFEYIVREDRPIDEILTADYTFLNSSLAMHYGIDDSDVLGEKLVRITVAGQRNRGGLLGLGAIHAVTSAPLRTSAVKRGDWVLRRVLGTPVPPPPADAGSIAADDVLTDGLTVRKRLEAHRTNQACQNCHSRIDPLGFALEPFDPIGRWRDTYRDGQPIDAGGVLSDGTEVVGFDGLRGYLRREQVQFERNLAVKLLGYALGRAELASDRPLIEHLLEARKTGGEYSKFVLPIVTSQQFTHRRR